MNRQDFQNLTQIRLEDAKELLFRERYECAYYIAGYAVECALKSCIAKNTNKYDFPPSQSSINEIYTHDLTKLIKAAGLKQKLDEELKKESAFENNWVVTKDWNENTRYESRGRKEAEDIYSAITAYKYGVLKWLKIHW